MIWYMSVNSAGAPIGWSREPYDNALEVDETIRELHINNPDYIWNGITLIEEIIPIHIPTNEEIISNMTSQLENYYDSIAQTKRYDNRLTCALRAGYAGPFQSEGTAFAIWMDTCNAYAYSVMNDCLNNIRPIPTIEVLISELPIINW
jgi:hypothetical protein